MADVLVLFDEYAAAFARGEAPDLRSYLVRAGDGADELAALVDGFLVRAEAPAPAAESVAATRAWIQGGSPLGEVRRLRGLGVGDLVAALVRLLGLDPGKAPKVERYYRELESGELEPRGVDGRVWESLASLLSVPAGLLRTWRPVPPPPAQVLFRSAEAAPAAPMAALSKAAGAPVERDEVDRLFGR